MKDKRIAFGVSLLCLGVCFNSVYSSVLVVTTTEDPGLAETTEVNDVTFDPVVSSEDNYEDLHSGDNEPSTKKPGKPEIYSFHVVSDIQYRYSRTHVTSRVANRDLKNSREATFQITLPDTAFISKFSMIMDGKVYDAYVKEKDEAKKIYNAAQSAGQTAGLVETSPRNSNIFNVNVNVKAKGKVTFNLTYEELLTRRLGRYEQVININREHFKHVKDFMISVNIAESQRITHLRVPDLRNDVESVSSNDDNLQDVKIQRPTKNKATITWSPTSATQDELNSQGVGGQFVVQYDVDRNSSAGEVLVMEGYFVHFFTPEKLKPLRKHVVFVLDISGSMWGRKMEQLKESQKKILDDLSSDDFFNIITFSSEVHVWNPNENFKTGEYNSKLFRSELMDVGNSFNQPYPATKENILLAKKFIDSLAANGGTNIYGSLMTAINLTSEIRGLNRDFEKSSEIGTTFEPLPTALPLQDATTTMTNFEFESFENSETLSALPKNVESLIIFLTDGEPTVGVTDPPYIQKLIKEANKNLTFPIFSLGFGEGADFPFLKKLSLQNYGFGRKIYEAADAALQLQGFYNEIASPMLSGVKFNYTSPEYNITDLTISYFPTIFNGTEIAVAGKLENLVEYEVVTELPNEDFPEVSTTTSLDDNQIELDDGQPKSPTIDDEDSLTVAERHFLDVFIEGYGREGVVNLDAPPVFCKPIDTIMNERPFPERPTPPPTPEDRFLERLWAYLTIKQLVDKDLQEDLIDAADEQLANTLTPKQQATQLAMRYGFVTPFTSLVVVKPNSSDVTDTISSDAKPEMLDSLSAPQSMQYYTVVKAPPMMNRLKLQGASFHKMALPMKKYARPSAPQRPQGPSSRIKASPPMTRIQSFPKFPARPHLASLPYGGIYPSSPQLTFATTPRPVFVHTTMNSQDYLMPSFEVEDDVDGLQMITEMSSNTLDEITWLNQTTGVVRISDEDYLAANYSDQITDDSGKSCNLGTGTGKCMHLKDCLKDEIMTDFNLYLNSYFCPIQERFTNTRYLGTCCSSGESQEVII